MRLHLLLAQFVWDQKKTNLLRLAPESIQQLEEFVTLFIPHAFCWKHLCNTGEELPSRSSSEELAEALKSHDLVIYIGHGSGVNYIPMHQIQSLENCAATLLMECSSGSLTPNGCYVPHGPALSYLLAGSPVIIGNLWEVTDKDINRFAKAMLDGWLEERSSSSQGCAQCKVAEEFEALCIRGRQGNAKKVLRKKSPEA